MITDEVLKDECEESSIPYGVALIYDGKKNIVLDEKESKEYPIGGMVCEYARLRPTDIKPVILSCPYFHQKFEQSLSADTMRWLFGRMTDAFGLATGLVVTTELLDYMVDFVRASEEQFEELLAEARSDKIREFILEDTGFEEFGKETIGQLLLTSYYSYASSYVVFKYSFDLLMKSASNEELTEEENGRLDAFFSMYGDNMQFQHIEFKIAAIDGKLQSVYQIKTGLSLLLFEAAHLIETETVINKCEHCGSYFVPDGRSDLAYCSYPLRDNPEKTCRDIGAQYKRAQKEKNDVATKAYRKVYMKYTVHLNRHPTDEEKRETFNRLKSEVKEWRKKMADGTATLEEYLDWLDKF